MLHVPRYEYTSPVTHIVLPSYIDTGGCGKLPASSPHITILTLFDAGYAAPMSRYVGDPLLEDATVELTIGPQIVTVSPRYLEAFVHSMAPLGMPGLEFDLDELDFALRGILDCVSKL